MDSLNSIPPILLSPILFYTNNKFMASSTEKLFINSIDLANYGIILLIIFIITRTLLYGVDTPGYASLLVAILFFGSMQLISVGMLGEYIGRIYMETKRRPLYLIRKRHGDNA